MPSFCRLTILLLAVAVLQSADAWAQCGTQSLADVRAAVRRDTAELRRLAPSVSESELLDFVGSAQNAKNELIAELYLAAGTSALRTFLKAPEAALRRWDLAGVELKNGLGSLGTAQRQAIVSRYMAAGGAKAKLGVPLVRVATAITDKKDGLEALDTLSKWAEQALTVVESGLVHDDVGVYSFLFGLAADITKRGALPVAIGQILSTSTNATVEAFLLARGLEDLDGATTAQLDAIRIRSEQLQANIEALKRCEGIARVAALGVPASLNDLEELEQHVARKLDLSCCMYRNQQEGLTILEALIGIVASGRSVTYRDPQSGSRRSIGTSNLGVCGTYLVSWQVSVTGDAGTERRDGDAEERLCPVVGSEFYWGHEDSGTRGREPDPFEVCKRSVTKVGRADFRGSCEHSIPERPPTYPSLVRHWKGALSATGDSLQGSEEEDQTMGSGRFASTEKRSSTFKGNAKYFTIAVIN